MKAVRWGVLGVSGHFLQRVLSPVRKSEIVEMYGIASRGREKAEEAAGRYGIEKPFPSYGDLLADPSIEAVYIPLPNHIHLEWIKRAADAGKHILCEKPLTLDSREAKEAVDYAGKKGVRLMEAFMYRLQPQWQRVRELVAAREIGNILSINTYFAYNNPDPGNIRNILSVGGGALMDIGCYAVSSTRFILDSEPQRVMSLLYRHENFGTDAVSSAILDFGGAQAVFTVGTRIFPDQRVDIHGSSGKIFIHLPFNTFGDVPAQVTVVTSVGSRTLSFDPVDQYFLEFEAFSRAIRKNTDVPIHPQDAVRNMRVLDALFASEKSKSWVAVS